MKKLISLIVAVAALAFGSLQPCFAYSYGYTSNTNFNSVGVGFLGSNGNPYTYTALTGVASTGLHFKLNDFMNASYASVATTGTSATNWYTGAATGLTNQAAVIIPSPASNSSTGVIQFEVPGNYLTAGVLELRLHESAQGTAQGVSIQATAYVNAPDSLTVTTALVGPIVNVPLNAIQTINTVALSGTATVAYPWTSAFAPHDIVTYKIAVSGTDALTVQIMDAFFSYKPWGVIP